MVNKHELQKYGGHGKVQASEESKKVKNHNNH